MQHFVKLRPYVKEFWNTLRLNSRLACTQWGHGITWNRCVAFANGGAQCDQVDLEQLRQRVAHLEFEVRREAQSRTLCETESSAEDTATETDASGGTTETETEAETVAVPFPVTKSMA
jgi:hypothetical protein